VRPIDPFASVCAYCRRYVHDYVHDYDCDWTGCIYGHLNDDDHLDSGCNDGGSQTVDVILNRMMGNESGVVNDVV